MKGPNPWQQKRRLRLTPMQRLRPFRLRWQSPSSLARPLGRRLRVPIWRQSHLGSRSHTNQSPSTETRLQ